MWRWNPDKDPNANITGPDLIMKQSMKARFPSQIHGLFQTPNAPVNVICDYMTRQNKMEFLVLHAKRYNHKLSNPGWYVNMVRSIESVEHIICLDIAGEPPETQPPHSYTKQDIINVWRSRNGFPTEILDTICSII